MRDFGLEAQRAAKAHLDACDEALEDGLWADGVDTLAVIASPACAPFDGCQTCLIREVLFAAWPILLDAAREELADGARAEQEDEPDRDGDGDGGDLHSPECHVLKLPPRADVQA
jgi:hypothetical protein